MALDGNILNYGPPTIRTGVTDAGPAFQDLLNDDPAGFVPPGLYRIATESTSLRPKIVECFGGSIATGYVGAGGMNSPVRLDEQVRFIVEVDNPFTVKSEQFSWRGGCFDFQAQTNHNGYVFTVDMDMVAELFPIRSRGWGHSLTGFTALGNFLEARDRTYAVTETSIGTGGVRYKMQGNVMPNGFVYWGEIDFQAFGCERALCHDSEQAGLTQDSAAHRWTVKATDTRCAVWSQAGRRSHIYPTHLAGPVFPNQALADSTPSIYTGESEGSGESGMDIVLPRFENFDAGQDGSYWNNSKTYDTDPTTRYWYHNEDSIDRAISMGTGQQQFEHNLVQFGVGAGLKHGNATTAELLDRNSAVNGLGKARFVGIINTDTGMMVYANGSTDNAVWRHPVTGAGLYTPI